MKSAQGQAMPAPTIPMGPEAFGPSGHTTVYWLGGAGVFINSRGTLLMVDPTISTIPASILPGGALLSEVNGTECLIPPPISAAFVPRLDAVLYTHSDDDHMGMVTAQVLRGLNCPYHATGETAAKLETLGVPKRQIVVHGRNERYTIGHVTVQMTPATHPWQQSVPEAFHGWRYADEDCTGLKFITPDGVIWLPGDTLPLPEHRQNTDVNLMFVDFSDDPFHYGGQNTLDLANHLSGAQLIAYHWGTLNMPDFLPQNTDPYVWQKKVLPPERLHILAAGEPYRL